MQGSCPGRIFNLIRILMECDIGEEMYKKLCRFDFHSCRAIVQRVLRGPEMPFIGIVSCKAALCNEIIGHSYPYPFLDFLI